MAHGAAFRPGCKVKKLHWTTDAIWVGAETDGTTQFFRAKLVVGADGANSTVSRAIGNKILDGATAVSLRGYYQRVPGSPGPGGF